MLSAASTLSTGVRSSRSGAVDNPEYDVSRAVSGESNSAAAAPSGFADFGLPTAIVKAIRALGYEKPTAIQLEAIPALLLGCDVTGVAQTGTGKTAAYGLPLLTAIDPTAAGVQALVLVPTRELAIQVADALGAFAANLHQVGIAAIYGGAPMGKQINSLKRGAQVVVGTPGRVIDLIERKSLHLDNVVFTVLDEADEMLRMGFAEDVDRILTEVPSARQTALFSATMPKEIRRVAAQHLRRPVDVSVAASATPVANIDQSYIVLPFRDKALALQRIIAVSQAEAAVVFVRTRSACDELGTALISAGVKAAYISGDVSQNERERTIDRLRGGQVDVLVATDVAARGMDVERIGLVVNFDSPADPETYIHRVGRTGRAGRSGRAVTFFTPKETSRLRVIEKTIGRKLEEVSVPSGAQVLDRQAEAALAAAKDRHAAGRLGQYTNALTVAADIAGISVPELAAALLATVVGDDGTAPVEIQSTSRPARGARDGAPRTERRTSGRYERGRSEGRGARSGQREGGTGTRAPRGADTFDRPSRGSRFDRSRDDRAGRSAPPRHYDEAPRALAKGGRRDKPWESPSGSYGSPSGRDDRRGTSYPSKPAKSKPRWDAARRAERASTHADRQGPSRSRATGQRRGQRSVA